MKLQTWTKACDCKAGATSGEIRLAQLPADATGVRVNFTMIPGPSCDACGKPWTRNDIESGDKGETPV